VQPNKCQPTTTRLSWLKRRGWLMVDEKKCWQFATQEYSFFTFWQKFSFNSITSVKRFFHFSSFVTISCVEPPITHPLLLFSKIFFFIFSFQPFFTKTQYNQHSWNRQSACCHVLQDVVVALPTVTFSFFFCFFGGWTIVSSHPFCVWAELVFGKGWASSWNAFLTTTDFSSFLSCTYPHALQSVILISFVACHYPPLLHLKVSI
jgi:hypothetical protein